MKALICPMSDLRINKNIVRLTGFMIAAMIAAYELTGTVYIVLIITLDYFIRAFTDLKFSPLSWLAEKINIALGFSPKKIDKAPKIFAARVGFLFAFTLTLLFFINTTASLIVGLTLMSFALLESVFDICVGCLVYTHIIFPFFEKEKNKLRV